jgi:hypothetical protein
LRPRISKIYLLNALKQQICLISEAIARFDRLGTRIIRWELAMFIELIMFALATAFVAITALGHVLLAAAIVQCVREGLTRGASANECGPHGGSGAIPLRT